VSPFQQSKENTNHSISTRTTSQRIYKSCTTSPVKSSRTYLGLKSGTARTFLRPFCPDFFVVRAEIRWAPRALSNPHFQTAEAFSNIQRRLERHFHAVRATGRSPSRCARGSQHTICVRASQHLLGAPYRAVEPSLSDCGGFL
jgi:hypothetical protein